MEMDNNNGFNAEVVEKGRESDREQSGNPGETHSGRAGCDPVMPAVHIAVYGEQVRLMSSVNKV